MALLTRRARDRPGAPCSSRRQSTGRWCGFSSRSSSGIAPPATRPGHAPWGRRVTRLVGEFYFLNAQLLRRSWVTSDREGGDGDVNGVMVGIPSHACGRLDLSGPAKHHAALVSSPIGAKSQ